MNNTARTTLRSYVAGTHDADLLADVGHFERSARLGWRPAQQHLLAMGLGDRDGFTKPYDTATFLFLKALVEVLQNHGLAKAALVETMPPGTDPEEQRAWGRACYRLKPLLQPWACRKLLEDRILLVAWSLEINPGYRDSPLPGSFLTICVRNFLEPLDELQRLMATDDTEAQMKALMGLCLTLEGLDDEDRLSRCITRAALEVVRNYNTQRELCTELRKLRQRLRLSRRDLPEADVKHINTLIQTLRTL